MTFFSIHATSTFSWETRSLFLLCSPYRCPLWHARAQAGCLYLLVCNRGVPHLFFQDSFLIMAQTALCSAGQKFRPKRKAFVGRISRDNNFSCRLERFHFKTPLPWGTPMLPLLSYLFLVVPNPFFVTGFPLQPPPKSKHLKKVP